MTENKRKPSDFIQTFSGRQYWPLDPDPADIFIVDIAHALSNQCRFTGHCEFFYSVAQHSVLGSYLVPEEHQLQFLMHDSPEAFITDIARPVKKELGNYLEIEELNWRAICSRYAINPVMHESVKAMDNAMLLAERDQIMKVPPADWSVPGEPANTRIEYWSPERAKREFLDRFNELYQY